MTKTTCNYPLPNNYNYNPLPKGLRIAKSNIHGFGLFASEPIEESVILGPSHIKLDRISFQNLKEDYDFVSKHHPSNKLRTPLGGMINHSEKPNCELIDKGSYYVLTTIRNINSLEELTIDYNEYCT